MEETKKGINGFTLKIIAIVTMFIDHATAIFIEGLLNKRGLNDITSTEDYISFMAKNGSLYSWDLFLRGVGRIAFPIFIFMLVQGFVHTHSKAKYALRLLIFAIVAELPFNLAFGKSIISLSYQNVIWTLLMGFLFMWFDDFIHKKEVAPWLGYIGIGFASIIMGGYLGYRLGILTYNFVPQAPIASVMLFCIGACVAVVLILLLVLNAKKTFNELSQVALSVLILSVLMWAGDLSHTDYGGFGVLAIATAYVFKDNKKKSLGLCLIPLVLASWFEIFAIFDLIIINKYNGEKGKSMKYFFYVFYPAHLLILSLTAYFMGLLC